MYDVVVAPNTTTYRIAKSITNMLWNALFLFWICWLHFTCALAICAPNNEILSLQVPHVVSTPTDTMQSLAQDCNTLGISSFDVYGDFDLNSTSSYLRQFEHEVARELDKPRCRIHATWSHGTEYCATDSWRWNSKTHLSAMNRVTCCYTNKRPISTCCT